MDYIYPAARPSENEVDASSGASSRAPSTSKPSKSSVPPPQCTLPHEQLHGDLSMTEQGGVPTPHTLQSRALKYTVPLIMKSMQNVPLAQALGLGSPGAPAQHIEQMTGSSYSKAAMYADSEHWYQCTSLHHHHNTASTTLWHTTRDRHVRRHESRTRRRQQVQSRHKKMYS